MDGLVEHFNPTLMLMLKKFVGRKGKDWDEYLRICCLHTRKSLMSPQVSPRLNCCLDGGYEGPLTFSRKHGLSRKGRKHLQWYT